MSAIRWALVGASTIAKEWGIPAIQAKGGVPAFVVSADPARARAYADANGVFRATNSMNEALEGVDAVYISTTNELHKAQTLKADGLGFEVPGTAGSLVPCVRRNARRAFGTDCPVLASAAKQSRCLPSERTGLLRCARKDERVFCKRQWDHPHQSQRRRSLVASDCMTQRPIGNVILRSDKGAETLHFDHGDLYERSVDAFHRAVAGNNAPAATGEDGVRSMAIAFAALQSARSGRAVPVEAGV